MDFLLYPLLLLPGLTAVAVGAGQAAARGRRPWMPLAVVWLAVTAASYIGLRNHASHPLPAFLALLAPLGAVALAVEMEVQRGRSLRQAGSVGVLVGVVVAIAMPFLFRYLLLGVTCARVRGCL